MSLAQPLTEFYLPPNLKEEDFYRLSASLLDEAYRLSDGEHSYLVIDDLIKKIILEWNDEEALAAYYNLFIRPMLGTAHALKYVMKLLDLTPNGVFDEWFNMLWPMPAYKISVNFGDIYPRNNDKHKRHINWDQLIDLFLLIKNERIWLGQITMNDCPNPMFLDYGHLDFASLDDTIAYIHRGVRICVYEKHPLYFDGSDLASVSADKSWTTWWGELVQFRFIDALDEYIFGDRTNTITANAMMHSTIRTAIVPLSTVVPGSISHTGTSECEVVFDEWGQLDDGRGFNGVVVEVSDTFYFDYPESMLSDKLSVTFVDDVFFCTLSDPVRAVVSVDFNVSVHNGCGRLNELVCNVGKMAPFDDWVFGEDMLNTLVCDVGLSHTSEVV